MRFRPYARVEVDQMTEHYVDSGGADRVDPLVDAIGSVSRYDLVSTVIPLVLLAATTVGLVADVPLNVALAAASVISSLFVADALFVNPPDA